MTPVDIPLPWERLLWRGRPAFPFPARERYFLTDFRLVRVSGARADELVLRDIVEIQSTESGFDRVIGASTLRIHARAADGPADQTPPRLRRSAEALRATTEAGRDVRPPLVLRHVRRGPQLAALLELLSGERPARLDPDGVRAAIAWTPRTRPARVGETLTGVAAVLLAVFGIAVGLHGKTAPPAVYGPDDPIEPAGRKRPHAEIVAYMENEIMPWARATLGPIKGGSDRITCETCHGASPQSRDWGMPGVGALPQADLIDRGWESYGGPMDAQMRNAIYGYLAESDKQARAAYMREVVMPGMARLLRRPPYDFTQTYEYNRSRLAFGCYHCHQIR